MAMRGRLSANQVPAYMNFITKVSKDHPRMLSKAIHLAALGYHFEKITSQQNAIHGFKEFLAAELETFRQARVQDGEEFRNQRQALFTRVQARYESIPNEFRYAEDGIEHALATFRLAVNAQAEHLAVV